MRRVLINNYMNINEEIKKAVVDALNEHKAAKERTFVYGLKGLANLLGISYSTAYRIKKSRVLAKATFQINRVIAFDADMVLSILCEGDTSYTMRMRVNDKCPRTRGVSSECK